MYNWNIGLLFYIINCFIGSFAVSFQFTNEINSNPSFYFSNSEMIGIAVLLAGVSLLIFLPLFLFTNYVINRKGNEKKKVINSNLALLIYSMVLILFNTFQTRSIIESLMIILCYLVPGLFFLNFYLVLRIKKENF
jgi:hypothetical protein